jgi:hypothetical protein
MVHFISSCAHKPTSKKWFNNKLGITNNATTDWKNYMREAVKWTRISEGKLWRMTKGFSQNATIILIMCFLPMGGRLVDYDTTQMSASCHTLN